MQLLPMRNNSVWSLPFDASTDFVTRRELLMGDETALSPGADVPEGAFSPRTLRQLFDMRHIVHRVTYDALVNGLTRFETDPFATAEEPVAEPEPVADETPLTGVVGEKSPELVNLPPVVLPAALPGLPAATIETPVPAVPPVSDTPEVGIEQLREDAKALNIDFDGRWGVKRLQAAIDDAKALENGKSA
jgi:hypothetical protein